jgi:outer membrane protein
VRPLLRAAATAAAVLAATAVFAQTEAAPSAPAQARAAEPAISLTVNQAIDRAMANQPLIQQAEAAVAVAQARVGEAQSLYYPMVSGNASYNRLSDQSFTLSSLLPSPSVLAQLGITIAPNYLPLLETPLSLVPLDNWDFNIGLNQVIFQFGKRGVQVKLAENGMSSAQIGVAQIRMSLAFQAAQGFYTVLFLRRQVEALDSQLQNLQEHLEATRVRTETGAATRYDELSTEVRVSALQSQRIEADSQYKKQLIGLKQLLGIEEPTGIEFSGDFTLADPAVKDEQTLLASAMAQRPDIRQAVEAENAAALSRQVATMSALPTLSAHASMGYKTGILPAIDIPTFNWVAGVQLNVPIFQGFLYAHQQEEADKRLHAAQDNTAAIKRSVTTQVLQAIQDAEASHQQVQSAQGQLDQTREMLEVVKVQYELGMLTNLEYLDAQAAQERAQLGSLQAQYREVLSRYALKQATGTVIWTPEAPAR